VRPQPSRRATHRRHQSPSGFFAQADGGTLILDELGELPRRPGQAAPRAPGRRDPARRLRPDREGQRPVVASTNRDLAAEAKTGTFREDLYYRLAVVELVVPPLCAREDDIPALAEELGRRYGERFGTAIGTGMGAGLTMREIGNKGREERTSSRPPRCRRIRIASRHEPARRCERRWDSFSGRRPTPASGL
jgi:hypothetical protein